MLVTACSNRFKPSVQNEKRDTDGPSRYPVNDPTERCRYEPTERSEPVRRWRWRWRPWPGGAVDTSSFVSGSQAPKLEMSFRLKAIGYAIVYLQHTVAKSRQQWICNVTYALPQWLGRRTVKLSTKLQPWTWHQAPSCLAKVQAGHPLTIYGSSLTMLRTAVNICGLGTSYLPNKAPYRSIDQQEQVKQC